VASAQMGDRRIDRASGSAGYSVRDQMTAIYEESWSSVFRYAFVLLRHREDAEDVASEAFSRAYAAWEGGHGPSDGALPWLLLITRRVITDRQRRRRLIAWLPLSGVATLQDDGSTSAFGQVEVWLWFEHFSRALSERQREALILRYQFDLPDEAIGQVMRLSRPGVRTLVARALASLRNQPEILE
jgi:RNA polymerase sigma-70 factor (ECF subfamily)